MQEYEMKPKVALCRRCYGKGTVKDPETGEITVCPQCEGSGRVSVSAKTVYDIRPYRPRKQEEDEQ